MNGCIRLITMPIWPTVIWDRKNQLTSCFLVTIILLHVSTTTVLERLQSRKMKSLQMQLGSGKKTIPKSVSAIQNYQHVWIQYQGKKKTMITSPDGSSLRNFTWTDQISGLFTCFTDTWRILIFIFILRELKLNNMSMWWLICIVMSSYYEWNHSTQSDCGP